MRLYKKPSIGGGNPEKPSLEMYPKSSEGSGISIPIRNVHDDLVRQRGNVHIAYSVDALVAFPNLVWHENFAKNKFWMHMTFSVDDGSSFKCSASVDGFSKTLRRKVKEHRTEFHPLPPNQAEYSKEMLTPTKWHRMCMITSSLQLKPTVQLTKNGKFLPNQVPRKLASDYKSQQSEPAVRLTKIEFTDDNAPDSSLFLQWRIADIRLWASRLDIMAQQDRDWFRDRALTGREPDLVGYWRVDEGKGDIIHDQTRFGNAGSVSQGTWQPGGYPCPKHGYLREDLLKVDRASAELSRLRLRATQQTSKKSETEVKLLEIKTKITSAATTVSETKSDISSYEQMHKSAIRNMKSDFQLWANAFKSDKTTLRNFIAELSDEMDSAAKWLQTEKDARFTVRGARADIRMSTSQGAETVYPISHITQASPAVLAFSVRQPFDVGTEIQLADVRGMTDINDVPLVIAEKLDDMRVTVSGSQGEPFDTTDFEPYSGGGSCHSLSSLLIAFPQPETNSEQSSPPVSSLSFDFNLRPEPEAEKVARLSDMTGYSEDMARKKLAQAGFRPALLDVAAKRTEENGVVLGQIPAPSKTLALNTIVTLLVGRDGEITLNPVP